MADGDKGSAKGNTGTGGTPPPASGEGTGASGGDKTFTQAELDAIIQDRVKKAQSGRVDLSEFGLKSKEDLQKIVQAQQAAEEQAKTDQQKAIDEAKKAGRTEAEQELMGKANARLVRSEFITAAKDRNVVDPNALYLIAKGEGRLDALKVTEADEVEGLDDTYWEELLKDRAYMVKEAGGGSPPPPGTTGQKPPTPGNANAGSQGGTKAPDDRREQLLKRYPALSKRR